MVCTDLLITECGILSLRVDMESGFQATVLQMFLHGFCQETDQAKIYKILKEMSSVLILCNMLVENGFRKTIKCLKKQQLLVCFLKVLVGM